MIENCAALIPARLESTRLPRKVLADLCGAPLIQRTYDNLKRMNLFETIVIATDSAEVAEVSAAFGATVVMTGTQHESGTSRIAEAAANLDFSIYVNVQADEPFLRQSEISDLLSGMQQRPQFEIATLFCPSTDPDVVSNPNTVKVVRGLNDEALYFSRAQIPYPRDEASTEPYLTHLGVYAYRDSFLRAYPSLAETPLEHIEKLEQLRFLANGYKMLLVEAGEKTIAIDTADDLARAKTYFEKEQSCN